MNNAYSNRYILDALYGPVWVAPDLWPIVISPELQRLREIRLCNINSLCLTGVANINRYEHAIGTFHLASECIRAWPRSNPFMELSPKEERRFLLAALLHDVISGAFGHSVEYIEASRGFEHEKGFRDVVLSERAGLYEYLSLTLDQVFFGQEPKLNRRLCVDDAREIGDLISGEGRLGRLISASIDLDNIDNVVRMSYHMGLTRDGELAVRLARSMWVEGQHVVIKEESVPLVQRWQVLRKRLYGLLLCNPDEFAAKCMLSEALETAREAGRNPPWYTTDYELLVTLASSGPRDVPEIIRRLMIGDLYGCLGIYATKWSSRLDDLLKRRAKTIASEIAALTEEFIGQSIVVLHSIKDVDKTDRKVTLRIQGGDVVELGASSDRLLIGVFLKDSSHSMTSMGRLDLLDRAQAAARHVLSRILEAPDVSEIPLFSEVSRCE